MNIKEPRRRSNAFLPSPISKGVTERPDSGVIPSFKVKEFI